MIKTGYRCGGVGESSGCSRQERLDASIAWKALSYEVSEQGNEDDIPQGVASFLGLLLTTPWPILLAEFRRRYGDAPGIWLSRNKREASRYREYGDPEPIVYNREDVVVDLGGDGIFVLNRASQVVPAKYKVGSKVSDPQHRRVTESSIGGARI